MLAPVPLAAAWVCASAFAQTVDDNSAPPAQPTLPAVNVAAPLSKDAPTELSDSYTARGTTVGTRLPATLKETPQSVTVITRQRIEDQNLSTLDEIMAQTTGVTVDLSGTGVIPAFYSRAYPVDYFQYDGVPIQTGGASWSQPDMLMFDHVEMLRGAAGLFNGAGQPGGVINLVRKRPTATRQFSGAFGLGSWNMRRGEVDFSTPLNESGSVRTRLAAARDKRDSHVDYANSERTSLYGIVEADLSAATTIALGAGHQKRDWLPAMMGVPRFRDGGDLGLPRSTFLSTPWTYWNFETTQIFADLTHAFDDDWRLKLSVVSDHETSDLKYAYVSGAVDRQTLAGPMLAGGANAYDNKQLAFDATLTGTFEAFGRRLELVVGANWYDRQADSRGGRLDGFGGTPVDVFRFDPGAIADPGAPVWTSRSRTDTRQYGLYGASRLKLADPLTLLFGGRFSWWESTSRNLLTGQPTADYDQKGRFTPYAGLVYDLDPTWALYASYADIFRVQSNYRDEGGGGLPPVIGANYEAGIKGAFYGGKLNTSFAVFRIDERNRATQVSPTVIDGCCYAANGKVRSQGFEAEVSGQLLPGWQMAAGYTYNTSKYIQDPVSQGLPFRSFSPKHMLRLWTTYRLPGPWNAWDLGGGVNWQSATYSEGGRPAVRASQSSYAVVSLRAGYRIDRHWSASLNVNNLFDKTYYTRLGSGGFGPANFGNVYGEPRSVQLTLRARF
ncbi:MAG: TonB-dependent siderophore receptor [Burkholderiaceae bacterium]